MKERSSLRMFISENVLSEAQVSNIREEGREGRGREREKLNYFRKYLRANKQDVEIITH